jgi:hypothetical protein
VFEHDREMDGRGADGERRQTTHKVGPDSGRLGADFLAREDRSAPVTNARFAVTRPASADRPNSGYIQRDESQAASSAMVVARRRLLVLRG